MEESLAEPVVESRAAKKKKFDEEAGVRVQLPAKSMNLL